MDIFAELSARQQRPAHPTMAAPLQQSPQLSPKMKFPFAPTVADATLTETNVATTVGAPTASTRSSQETLSSPSSPQRVNTATSTGSSPTKTSSDRKST